MADLHALPAELTIYTVGEWHPRLLHWIGSAAASDAIDDAVSLDASSVAEIDAAGLQLLVSMANALARQMRVLALLHPSPPLVAACNKLGADFLLADAARVENPA